LRNWLVINESQLDWDSAMAGLGYILGIQSHLLDSCVLATRNVNVAFLSLYHYESYSE